MPLAQRCEKLRYDQFVSNAPIGGFDEYGRRTPVFTIRQKTGAGTIRGFNGKREDGVCGTAGKGARETAGLPVGRRGRPALAASLESAIRFK